MFATREPIKMLIYRGSLIIKGPVNMHICPIHHSYWVLDSKLLAGEYPRDKEDSSSPSKIDALIQAGVSAFIDLTEEKELKPYSNLLDTYKSRSITHERFPIHDGSVPVSKETVESILDAIDKHIDQGRLVYVHCLGGIGRTGVIVGCWLSRHGFPGESALVKLRELWQQCPKSVSRKSPETDEQERYIIEWKEIK